MSTPRRRAPRAGIVDAATKLFSEKGYAQTTMSDVARAAGLQQSSLYYWFRNKEQLLQETLAVNRAPLEFIAEVGAGSGSPAVKLYRLLRFDTMQLAMSPIDFNEIQRIAHQQRADFHEFWKDYERLTQWVVDLIGAAIAEGRFIDCDKVQTAGLLLNFDANWYRYQWDQEAELGHKRDRENLAVSDVRDENAGTDVDAMEAIARKTPLSRQHRPQWDLRVLSRFGIQASADENIWQRVWTKEERINNASTPMFLIEGRKAGLLES